LHRISRVKVLAGVFWYPVTDGNCVAERRGGEQPEVNDQSVTQVNSIRPAVVASPLVNGEAQVTHGPLRAATTLWSGKPDVRNPRNASGRRKVAGDGMIGRFGDKTQGYLDAAKAGVHAPSGTEEPGVQESEHP
jgi:hypothetical protein